MIKSLITFHIGKHKSFDINLFVYINQLFMLNNLQKAGSMCCDYATIGFDQNMAQV